MNFILRVSNNLIKQVLFMELNFYEEMMEAPPMTGELQVFVFYY
ncbi:hypothetical protein DET57_11960 [Klebsiella oxytoca]|uniref:Uncharacterized protein n=1 Tax=Klebsiella oxytoca TaxID=571 RepID=A0A318FH60_KLEOX|nr:hypothetical protein DET57_11960 [Klebsiella oxytoca]